MFSNLQDSLLKLKRCAEIPEFIWRNFFYKYFIKAEHRTKHRQTPSIQNTKNRKCVWIHVHFLSS